jgi:leader peptidase (prepilin peptidase) / N-methyltransferase
VLWPVLREIQPALKRAAPKADHHYMAAAAFAGVFGAIFGSFLNVVAYRLPRHESVVLPPSQCPGCGARVRPYDNIPILSWLLLRGHCRSCAEPISPRYPVVEALTAVLCVGAVLVHHTAASIALSVGLILIVIPAALIDLEYRIIPNRLTLLGAVLALALGTALDPAGEPARLIAGAAAGGFLLLAALAYPGGMGMGDVKLAGVMGLFLGAAVAPAILIALLAGVLYGLLVAARAGARAARKTAVPFGPFLALGAIVAVYAGTPLVNLYSSHFLR